MVEDTPSITQTDISSELSYILEEIEKTELLISETLMTLTDESKEIDIQLKKSQEISPDDSHHQSKSKKKKRKKQRKQKETDTF